MSQFFQCVSNSAVLPGNVPTSFAVSNGSVIPSAHIVNVQTSAGLVATADPDLSNNLLLTLSEAAPTYTNVTTGTYVVLTTDYFISVDASGGPVTIELPDAPTTQQFIIKDRTGSAASNNITVKSLSGITTVDGQANYIFVDNFESLECLYHAGNYEVF